MTDYDTRAHALEAIEQSGKATQQQGVLEEWLILRFPEEFTRQEISEALVWPINVVCARVDELMKIKHLVRSTSRPCRITGKRVQTFRANLSIVQQPLLFPSDSVGNVVVHIVPGDVLDGGKGV